MYINESTIRSLLLTTIGYTEPISTLFPCSNLVNLDFKKWRMITEKCYKYLSFGAVGYSPSGTDEDFSGSNTVQAHFRFWSTENFRTSGFCLYKVLLPDMKNNLYASFLISNVFHYFWYWSKYWFWTEYLHAVIFKFLSKYTSGSLNKIFTSSGPEVHYYRLWMKYACSFLLLTSFGSE